uniref:Uncharacterized protein n=1 Tax=Rhizophora mucronata TaxID=61149 RepID=A0A2P2LIZ4_RHIMU
MFCDWRLKYCLLCFDLYGLNVLLLGKISKFPL